jgi:FkbM family methyltransferase
MNFQVPVPFKMITTHELSQWRKENFWEKEPETIAWLQNFSNMAGDTRALLDVGANIGVYSMYWLSLNSNNFVTSIEPSSENYQLLCSNMELNNYSDRANLLNIALSESPREGIFIESDLRPGASGGQFSVELVDGTDEASRFFSLSGDQVLEESAEGYLLKIDVDGLDFEILKGFSKSLASGRIKSILIETNESELEQILIFCR